MLHFMFNRVAVEKLSNIGGSQKVNSLVKQLRWKVTSVLYGKVDKHRNNVNALMFYNPLLF